MAYPQPVPVLKGKHAKEFEKRLSTKKLSKKQKSFYKDATKEYRKFRF